MMTVTFVDEKGKKLGRESFGCCPFVGSTVKFPKFAGEVAAVEFVPGHSGVEAVATLVAIEAEKKPAKPSGSTGGSSASTRSTKPEK